MSKVKYFKELLKDSIENLTNADQRFRLFDSKECDINYTFLETIGYFKITEDYHLEHEIKSELFDDKSLEDFIDNQILTENIYNKNSQLKNWNKQLEDFKTIFQEKRRIKNSTIIRTRINKTLFETDSNYFKKAVEKTFQKAITGYFIAPTGLLTSKYKLNE
jgi:hypothetical protein